MTGDAGDPSPHPSSVFRQELGKKKSFALAFAAGVDSLIERVKRRVVRDRGGRRLGRGEGAMPFGLVSGSGFRSSAGSVFWRNGCRVRR